jgi:hypothetical protein
VSSSCALTSFGAAPFHAGAWISIQRGSKVHDPGPMAGGMPQLLWRIGVGLVQDVGYGKVDRVEAEIRMRVGRTLS